MKIAWEFENTVYIGAPCWLVWQLFNDVLHWPLLGFGVRRVSSQGGPLDVNGRFTFTLKPLGLPVKVRARIVACRPWQLLAWQGKFWGVKSETKIKFTACDDTHTRLTFQEHLHGAGLILFSALFSMGRLSEINQKWLESIAAAAQAKARLRSG